MHYRIIAFYSLHAYSYLPSIFLIEDFENPARSDARHRERAQKNADLNVLSDFKAGRPSSGTGYATSSSTHGCAAAKFPPSRPVSTSYRGASRDRILRNGFILETPLPSCRRFQSAHGPRRRHQGRGAAAQAFRQDVALVRDEDAALHALDAYVGAVSRLKRSA